LTSLAIAIISFFLITKKMEQIMRKFYTLSLLLTVLILSGCAGTSPKKEYTSQPEVQKVSNGAFDAVIHPLKLGNPYYAAFQLEVKNKTRQSLSIDWNRTRYLNNHKDQGRFAFKGIDPESVKSGIPNELIPGGQTLKKNIFPLKTLGFMRGGDVPKSGESNFFPGILPDGINSVLLVVVQENREWKEILSIRFSSKQMAR
jgi:hypothetical protein